MNKSIKLAMIAMAVGIATNALASSDVSRDRYWSPLGIGIAAPAQFPCTDWDVYGIRVGGLFGNNHNVYGIDCGLAEISTGDFAGIQAAALTWTTGDAAGIQLGAFANAVNGSLVALQVGAVNVVNGAAGGLQFGVINRNAAFTGLQVGG